MSYFDHYIDKSERSTINISSRPNLMEKYDRNNILKTGVLKKIFEMDLNGYDDIGDILRVKFRDASGSTESLKFDYEHKNRILQIFTDYSRGDSVVIDFIWSKQKLRNIKIDGLYK